MPNDYLKVNYKEVSNVYVPTKETVEALYLPLTGTNSLSGNIIPNANKTVDLGSTTNKFKNIYAGIITGEVIHAPTLATNEIEPDTNTKLVISGGTSNEVDIQSNVGIGGNLIIGSSTNTTVIGPDSLTLNGTAKTAWQEELGITQGGLTQEQADARYLQLSGGTMNGNAVISIPDIPVGNSEVQGILTIGNNTPDSDISRVVSFKYSFGGSIIETMMGPTYMGQIVYENEENYNSGIPQATSILGSTMLQIGIDDNSLTATNDIIKLKNLIQLGSNYVAQQNIGVVIDQDLDLHLNSTALPKWQSELQITPNAINQTQADGRYLQLTGTAASATQLATSRNFSITGGATASAVAFNGTQDVALNITSLDATKLSGTIPTTNLPSYVDDVVEYANLQAFPPTGESGKIYVALDTNLTYRWGGSNYVEISPSLALGTTSDTAFRGDYGQTAYNHANAKGNQYASGFYKIQTNDQGHVTATEAVSTSDISTLVDTRYLQLTGGTLSGTLNFGDSISIDGTDGLTLNEDMVSQWQSVLAVPTNALTQSSADTRYLQLTGGTVSGSTTFTNGIRVGSSTGPTITNQGSSLVISSNIDMNGNTIQNVTIGGYLTESAADEKYLKLTGGTVSGSTTFNTDTHFTNIVEFSGASDVSFENGISVLGGTLLASGNVTIDNTGQLNLQTATLTQWQQVLEIPKFVVSSTQPSDTNVIWLKPVS